jgi:dCTP deaminase
MFKKESGKGMTVKSDLWIIRMAKRKRMIEPFFDHQVSEHKPIWDPNSDELEKTISYGVSSYGYDIRVGDSYKLFTNMKSGVVDPKDFDPTFLRSFRGDECIIPPNSFALASSVEYFRIPRNVITVCLGKSTYARCGIIVNITALEPEWEGNITIEISNTTPLPVKIYSMEGIAQILFFESDEMCRQSYKDKKGKYQGQTGITLAR